MSDKIYIKANVYQALQKRLAYIFAEFEHIYVSFSGGKDSGVLLALTLQYMREHGINRKIGVFHMDYEAQYTATTDYVERVMTSNQDLITPYWCCMPMSVPCTTSMHQSSWIPWNPEEKAIWVRDMPGHDSVINIDNHPFDFYEFGMIDYRFQEKFERWYQGKHGGGKTCSLVGIRTQESLHRYAAIMNKAGMYDGHIWTTRSGKNSCAAYPLYDWEVDDIWTANARFEFDYNKLYDLMYYAGIKPHDMRVASPFLGAARESLNLYRIIEPQTWGRVLGRVNGANFTAIYGASKAMAFNSISLPKGHTWKSYLDFLLSTLPESTREKYLEKFNSSINYWTEKGGALAKETADELRAIGAPCDYLGEPTRNIQYTGEMEQVKFTEYPDDLPDITDFKSVPSYKRMCICILKNDYACKYMGFGLTKLDMQRRKAAIEKYKNL
jgi:predicted phosphoadenosine phosphosulfate sulfurtransferase